jgi:hypothetical protein
MPLVQKNGVCTNFYCQGEGRRFARIEPVRGTEQRRHNGRALLPYPIRQRQPGEPGDRRGQTDKQPPAE